MTDTAINTARIINLVFGGKKKRKAPDGKYTLPPFAEHKVTIEFDKLPEASQAKIIEYGLSQYIGDATAGAGDQVDFDTGIKDQVARLTSGDFTRSTNAAFGGSVLDSVEKMTTASIRKAIKDKLAAAGLKVGKDQAISAEKFASMVAAFEADAAKVAPYREAAEAAFAAQQALAAAAGENTAETNGINGLDAEEALKLLGL